MKRTALLTAALMLSSSLAFGATKTYQATGPVLEVKDERIRQLEEEVRALRETAARSGALE